MKNLLTKTLLISLLLSVTIASGVQVRVIEGMRSARTAAATGVRRMGGTLVEVVTTLAERAKIGAARNAVTIASGVQVDLRLSPTEIVAMTQSLTKAAVMAREVTNVAKAVARAKEIVAVAEPGPLVTTEGEVKVMIGLVLAGLVVLKVIIGDKLHIRPCN